MQRADTRPFLGLPGCVVVLPERTGDPFAAVDAFCALLTAERAELEAELGCPVRIVDHPPGSSSMATCLVGPAGANPTLRDILEALGESPATGPLVRVDRSRRLVVIDGPDLAAVSEAFQLLRTACRAPDGETGPALPGSPAGILATIAMEVADTWPSFALRNIDWPDVLRRHESSIMGSDASLESLQRLFADLHDAHTWVRDTSVNARLPYRAWLDPDRAELVHVPRWSRAWALGVRAGDALLDLPAREWWERTAATPRTRALVAGYRALAGHAGEERSLRVRTRSGDVVAWSETLPPLPWHEPISWRVLDSGTGYMRVRGWMFTPAWVAALDEAFAALARTPRLLVDLRGNVGGQLVAATHFRDRFLDGETLLGTVQFSIGGGELSDLAPITGRPAPGVTPWLKPVRILVDRQTYSASEDAILGLGGLPHVQLAGEPTGGGSGRPRTIRLRDGMVATISTALTYDRSGRCIESAGLPVDIPLPLEGAFSDPLGMPSAAIREMADRHW